MTKPIGGQSNAISHFFRTLLETIFGPLTGLDEDDEPLKPTASAWRDELRIRAIDPTHRYRRGVLWTPSEVARELTRDDLAAADLKPRLDELSARTGVAFHVDFAAWGSAAPSALAEAKHRASACSWPAGAWSRTTWNRGGDAWKR